MAERKRRSNVVDTTRTLVIEIELENDAFQGGFEEFEVKRILNELQQSNSIEKERIRDVNGNTVGFSKIVNK